MSNQKEYTYTRRHKNSEKSRKTHSLSRKTHNWGTKNYFGKKRGVFRSFLVGRFAPFACFWGLFFVFKKKRGKKKLRNMGELVTRTE